MSLGKVRGAVYLFFTLIILQSSPGHAATVVQCGIPIEQEMWTLAGSPYLINCDVQVDSLEIQPGVTILFLSNVVFRVTGFLHANGSASQPIVFTSTNAAVGWQGILFDEVASGSRLDHCVVEGSGNSGVRIDDCVVDIRNTVFRNNVAPLGGGGLNINNTIAGLPEFVITGCTFTNNAATYSGAGLQALMGGGRLKLVACHVLANHANPSNAGGVDTYGGGVYVQGDSEIINCVIANNTCYSLMVSSLETRVSYGAGVYSAGDLLLKNCVLTNNVAVSVQGGFGAFIARGAAIYVGSGSLTNVNCTIALNDTSGQDGVNGAAVFIGAGQADFLNCTIVYNESDIAINGIPESTRVHNSIVYFNNSGGVQMEGVTNVNYCDVEGPVPPPGQGNKNVGPNIGPLTTNPATCLRILFSSQCVDTGDPSPIYNDLCFPPSRGTARNDMGAHGGPGACCWDGPCECPIVGQVKGQITCAGMSVTLCATVAGSGPFSYQWRYHGTNSANAPAIIPGATDQCLTLSNVEANQAGFYSVRVSNPLLCAVESNPALLLVLQACVSIDLYPGLSITGQVGRTYCIQYATDLSQTTVWTSLTNFTLSTPDYFYRDPQPARHCDSGAVAPPRRFYRVIEGPCP